MNARPLTKIASHFSVPAAAFALALSIGTVLPTIAQAQVAIRGETVYTSAGDPIKNGTIVIRDGKISAIGQSSEIVVPEGYRVLSAKVVTPGLIDAHSTVGLAGILNQTDDQDQLDNSTPIQPELRAIDAYNAHDPLVDWVRSFGVTTIHTGHAPGELIAGQTMVAKTVGNTVEDAVMVETRALACTLAASARKSGGRSPGTRGKMVSMLRSVLIKAREYADKHAGSSDEEDGDEKASAPPRDLRLEALGKVLAGELPLMITAQKSQDISSALRLAKEFEIQIWIDGAAESYLLVDEIADSDVAVIVHPTMMRTTGEQENASLETAATLMAADIPVALQAGYESYVPKTRVVLFEAAIAAANGLSFQEALDTITIGAAELLGIDDRVGSLEVGKDGDVALFDGDPFEYTSHCVGVVIDGNVVSETQR